MPDPDDSLRRWDAIDTDELGLAALRFAQGDVGIGEVCPNWGPEIERYLGALGITEPAPYCAAAVSDWIVRAGAETLVASPINPSAVAKNLADQFRARGRWIKRRHLAVLPQPGWVAVWDRGTKEQPWRGHTGIVELIPGGEELLELGAAGLDVFGTVEGNIITAPGSQGVGRMQRRLTDPQLLGFGVLSGPMP